jgi:hypothetical protein
MHVAFIRWAGIAAILFALSLIAQVAFGIAAGISDESTAETLADIDDNRDLFLLDTVWSMANKLLFVPVIVAIFLMLREELRPYFLVAAVLFFAGTLLLAASAAIGIPLADAASDYVAAADADRALHVEDGEALVLTSDALGLAGVGCLAIAILITGVLMLRSVVFRHWLALVAIAMGVLGLAGFVEFAVEGFGALFLAVFVLQVIWLLGAGWTMWRMGQPLRTA